MATAQPSSSSSASSELRATQPPGSSTSPSSAASTSSSASGTPNAINTNGVNASSNNANPASSISPSSLSTSAPSSSSLGGGGGTIASPTSVTSAPSSPTPPPNNNNNNNSSSSSSSTSSNPPATTSGGVVINDALAVAPTRHDSSSAAGEVGAPPNAPSYKLFVGQVPRSTRHEDLFPLFSPYGDVQEVFILRDPHSGVSKGCCFVRYRTKEAAEACIAELHNRYTLPDAGNPLQISFASPKEQQQVQQAQAAAAAAAAAIATGSSSSSSPSSSSPPTTPGSLNPLETKLFVGQIPTSAKESEVKEVFEKLGEVREVHIMRHRDSGNSKGAGFVRYVDPASAKRAIAEISGKVTMEGGVGPLRVDIALPHTPGGGAIGMPAPIHHHHHHHAPILPHHLPLPHRGMMAPPPPPISHHHHQQQQQQHVAARMGMNGGGAGRQGGGGGGMNNPYMAMGSGQQPLPHLAGNAQSMQYQGWYPHSQLPLPPPPPPPPHHHPMDARNYHPQPHMDQTQQQQQQVLGGMKGVQPPQQQMQQQQQHQQQGHVVGGLLSGALHPQAHPQAMMVPSAPLQKLFVGGLTAQTSEHQLLQVFSHYGTVREVVVLRYPNGQSKLSGFVKFASEQEATLSVVSLDNRYSLPGSPRPMTVRYAGSMNQPPEHKLFVGHLPQHFEENDTSALFSPYGEVLEVFVMRDTRGATKGSAFVKFARRESAEAAISALHGVTSFGDRPLKVSFALSRANSGTNAGNTGMNNDNANTNANHLGGMVGAALQSPHQALSAASASSSASMNGGVGGLLPTLQLSHQHQQTTANVAAPFQFPDRDGGAGGVYAGGVQDGGSPYFYPGYATQQQQHLVSDLTSGQ